MLLQWLFNSFPREGREGFTEAVNQTFLYPSLSLHKSAAPLPVGGELKTNNYFFQRDLAQFKPYMLT